MPNAVLESFLAQRAEQIATMDSILAQVEGRDLVDAERGILEACRDRIAELDAQIAPLAQFEELREAHRETAGALPSAIPAQPRRADAGEPAAMYRSAGAFLADLCRASGCLPGGQFGDPDPRAAARVVQARAVDNQLTTDTPGVLPQPIVGQVVNLIDANRPLITSLGGAKALGGIPGQTFTRPAITQHVQVGKQSAEKTQLASRKMTITPIPFTKATYGGTVDISRQDIDWTSPSAWDILIKDLADVYSVQTEIATAVAFKADALGTAVPIGSAGVAPTLAQWTAGLYTAAMHSYAAALRMPDRVWCSLDVWAALGSLVDTTRVVFAPDLADGVGSTLDSFDAGGNAGLSAFRGDVLGLPRIVVPTFAAGTCIVGPSTLFEVYEEVIGLLSVVEPSILGVTVAYGGYLAEGTLAGPAFVPLTITGVMPTMLEGPGELATQMADAKADEDAPKSTAKK